MAQDNLARDLLTGEEDPLYDALVATLRGNARGRAFLDEYARRCRAADTAAALEALARIEALLTRDRPVVEAPEIDPDQAPNEAPNEAYVPFALDLQPDMAEAELAAVIEPRRSSADLLAQVMALSPEERIALFS